MSVIGKLKNAQWRYIDFPVANREFGFSHEHAKRRFLFRDEQLIESLGRDNPTYSYTIPFRETIVGGGWEALFTRVYPKFLAACIDRSGGQLYDPVHGLVTAKCVSLRESLTSEAKCGVDVVAEFIKAPASTAVTDSGPLPIETLGTAQAQSGFFDRQIEKVNWQQEPPPEPTKNIFEAIQAFSTSVDTAKGNIEGQMHRLASDMEKTTKAIDRLKQPDLAPTRRAARRLQFAAIALGKTAGTPPTPMQAVRLAYDIGWIALAAVYGMTVEELLKSNPSLVGVPLLPAGSTVLVKRAA